MSLSSLRTYRAIASVRYVASNRLPFHGQLEIYYKATTPNAAGVDFWRWWQNDGKKVAAAQGRKYPLSHTFVELELVGFRIYLFNADKISATGKLPPQPVDYSYAWSEGMDPPRPALARKSGSGRARPAGTVRSIPLPGTAP